MVYKEGFTCDHCHWSPAAAVVSRGQTLRAAGRGGEEKGGGEKEEGSGDSEQDVVTTANKAAEPIRLQ